VDELAVVVDSRHCGVDRRPVAAALRCNVNKRDRWRIGAQIH
jgi:hypothetical protein